MVGVRVQAVELAGGGRTWTVLGDDHLVIEPVEEFLEHHRVLGSSPNTVRSYAKGVAMWWEFIARQGIGWEDPGVGVLRAFVTWLRTGLVPTVTPIGPKASTGRAPREEWHVCIEGHHPGYISFERYLANQERLRANWRPPRGEGGGAAREGRALLQGLIRCGRCGRRMQVGYSGKTLVPNYSCVRGNQLYGTGRCQSVGGRRIERVVLDAVFEALAPAGIEATLRALEHAEGEHQARVRSAELELERAHIHADRARRQFDGCEPENRLVVRTLEREWEQRLTAVRAAERTLTEVAAKRPDPLTEQQIAWCRGAGADLRKVFDAPTTTDRERKQLLRAILTDVVVTVDRESEQHTADLRVVWEGEAVTEHTVPLPRTGSHTRCTDQDTIALVRQLAEQYPTSRSPRSSPAKDD